MIPELVRLTMLATTIAVLSYASYTDIKIRKVDNKVTITFLAITILYAAIFTPVALLVGTCFFTFGLLLHHVKEWGGADVKLFAALGYAYGSTPAVQGLINSPLLPQWLNLALWLLVGAGVSGSLGQVLDKPQPLVPFLFLGFILSQLVGNPLLLLTGLN